MKKIKTGIGLGQFYSPLGEQPSVDNSKLFKDLLKALGHDYTPKQQAIYDKGYERGLAEGWEQMRKEFRELLDIKNDDPDI